MKTIVISGAKRGVGKSTLAEKISVVIGDSEIVKIGHHESKPDKTVRLFPMGSRYQTVCNSVGDTPYLIIESNSILEEITPECVIYIAADNSKPSAKIAIAKADIISGSIIDKEKIECLAGRLSLTEATVIQIVTLAGAFTENNNYE